MLTISPLVLTDNDYVVTCFSSLLAVKLSVDTWENFFRSQGVIIPRFTRWCHVIFQRLYPSTFLYVIGFFSVCNPNPSHLLSPVSCGEYKKKGWQIPALSSKSRHSAVVQNSNPWHPVTTAVGGIRIVSTWPCLVAGVGVRGCGALIGIRG